MKWIILAVSVTLSRETPCSVPTNFCIAKQMQTQSAATQLCSRQCCVCQLLLVIASRNGELQRKRDDFQAAGAYSREITLQELSLEAIDRWFGGVRTCYFAQNCVCGGGVFEITALSHKLLSTCRTESTKRWSEAGSSHRKQWALEDTLLES